MLFWQCHEVKVQSSISWTMHTEISKMCSDWIWISSLRTVMQSVINHEMYLYLDICAAGRLLAVGDSSFTEDLLLMFVIPVFIFNKHVFTQTVGKDRHRSIIYCWESLQPHQFHLSSISRNSTHCFVPEEAEVEKIYSRKSRFRYLFKSFLWNERIVAFSS